MSEKLLYDIDLAGRMAGKETTAISEAEQKEAESPTEVRLVSGETQVRIAPEKGALATSFIVGGKEILYIDSEGFEDPSNKKPRTGIPLLVPFAGAKAPAPQHGGAREVPWTWVDRNERSTELSLDSQNLPEEMRASLKEVYGDDFEYEVGVKVSVGKDRLRYNLAIHNDSQEAKKFAPGLHPYFAIENEDRALISSNIEGFSLAGLEGSRIFDMPRDGATFLFPSGHRISILASPQFKHIVAWGVDGADHICLEPFVADPKIETEWVEIPAGASEDFYVEFSVENEAEIKDFEQKIAKLRRMAVHVMESTADFMNTTKEAETEEAKETLRESLEDSITAYLVLSGEAFNLMQKAPDLGVRTILSDFILEISDDKDLRGLMTSAQSELVWRIAGQGTWPKEAREKTFEFTEKIAIYAADLVTKLVKYEQKKAEDSQE